MTQNIDASMPRKGPGSSVPNQWGAWFNNGTEVRDAFTVYAVCGTAGPNPDVNGDGVVNAVDALCVLRFVAGLQATAACPLSP